MQLAIIIAIFTIVVVYIFLKRTQSSNSSTRLPSFNNYDNAPIPDKGKLLTAATYLNSIDVNDLHFESAKQSTNKKLTQYVHDLDVVLEDINKNKESDRNLENLKLEGTKELNELNTVNTSKDLKNIKSNRLLFILIGDWKVLTQSSSPNETKLSIENKFKDLGINLPK